MRIRLSIQGTHLTYTDSLISPLYFFKGICDLPIALLLVIFKHNYWKSKAQITISNCFRKNLMYQIVMNRWSTSPILTTMHKQNAQSTKPHNPIPNFPALYPFQAEHIPSHHRINRHTIPTVANVTIMRNHEDPNLYPNPTLTNNGHTIINSKPN